MPQDRNQDVTAGRGLPGGAGDEIGGVMMGEAQGGGPRTGRTGRWDDRRHVADPVRLLVGGGETGGGVALVELRERRGGGPPRHVHSGEDEVVYVLAGRVTFEVDGAALDAPAGSCVLLPRGSEHTYRVVSAAARLLVVAAPAGIEGHYRELAHFAARPDGAGAVERLIASAAGHGVAITGPGPEPRRAPRPPPAPASRSPDAGPVTTYRR
ncbi:MAG: hypothetical protein AVDCRST_MAG88-4498 [uncultured Thermomicrobiales bacterium]|uniref:Cupin type-2 domain-containing protein n=1 Tax=uncultured Thermomicrobiales bacterium TaxID=1645740 RepID=A0A6J4VV99_9BACT|nr:MAG: hypothetical protein AVDCRST_MAG88-4498 [uncultured Thermomicrobiales bacterium]